ncbi:MAG: gamma-glutamylcyclotransferase [Clostridia bacterium]|jgi:gamma-glutamylcyclotransferase (GGCT)/AIG2-like uncharacterized protein YtfP|nr:gamma-glutamylcyclotransferase [Clostridia bacterium]
MKGIKVFVYGTLMKGFGNHRQIEEQLIGLRPGKVKGELYHLSAGYPALRFGEGTVIGELLTLSDPQQTLAKLDWLEGYSGNNGSNLYNRVEVEVSTDTGTEKAYCYIWSEENCSYLINSGTPVRNGDWRKYINDKAQKMTSEAVRAKIFTEGEYLIYSLGNKDIFAYVDAVHAARPKSDVHTDTIVEQVIKNTGCSGIIATISRTKSDLNRPINPVNKEAVLEYRSTIVKILHHLDILDHNQKLDRPYLHLALHGMGDRLNKDIEVGTNFGRLCTPAVEEWVVKKLKEGLNCKVAVNDPNDNIYGHPSLEVHRKGDINHPDYLGFSDNYNIVQVEINRTLRDNQVPQLVEVLSQIVIEFGHQFT